MDEIALQRFRAEVIGRKNLPTIPTVLARILQLVDQESTSGRDLIEVIEHDQALTAKMLRLANSAFFGQSRKVATIPRAVVLLGFTTVRNLALGVKVWDALGTGVSRAHLEELWQHAVAVALATKALTARLCAGDPDEAFTAGLLHDAGRLAMAMRLHEEYWIGVGGAAESQAIDTIESATFGVDHAEVGAWMLEGWDLPPGIVEAVREHHGAVFQPGVPGLLAIADRLVAWTDLGSGQLRPEAEQLLRTTGERGVTPGLWGDVADDLHRCAELSAIGRGEA
jgi:putative nucleotidyltransferase with HDIG domain